MSAADHGSPQLLHNMSSRPTTMTATVLRCPGRALVRFRLDDGSLLASLDSLQAELDEGWRRAGLRGAMHVYAFPPQATRKGLKVVKAGALLSINVLGRARGGLLLPGAALALDTDVLHRVLASDDARLVALAGASSS
jgi:hypothetical protein